MKRNGIVSALCFIVFLAAEAPDISVAEALVLLSILFFVPGIFPFVFRQSPVRLCSVYGIWANPVLPCSGILCSVGSCDGGWSFRTYLVDVHSFYCIVCDPPPLGNKDT